MAKVVAVEYLSLDGVMESPGWSGPFFNEELQRFQYDNLFGSQALLLGRVTYQGFKAAWPGMADDEQGFGERMNTLPKYVATTTLTEPEWNASFLTGDVAEAVGRLKAEPGADLLINGSADLFNHLSARGLIDEYRFMVFPVVVGEGRRLFSPGASAPPLRLVDSRSTASGVAVLTYSPV